MMSLRMCRAPTLWAVLVAVAATIALMPTSPAEAQSQTMQRILYGEVVSAERITIRDAPTGRGAQAGSTIGAVAGYALADGRDRWLGALVGGVLGYGSLLARVIYILVGVSAVYAAVRSPHLAHLREPTPAHHPAPPPPQS